MVDGKPREEIVHDEVSGRTRRKAIFSDNLEEEIGDEDDEDNEEELNDEDCEEEFEEIKLRSINPKVICHQIYSKIKILIKFDNGLGS